MLVVTVNCPVPTLQNAFPLKTETCGKGFTVKEPALVAVPLVVVTEMDPVVAADGTVAVICVAELTVYVLETPLKLTALAPVKFVPVITTDDPIHAGVGVKLVIVGGGIGA